MILRLIGLCGALWGLVAWAQAEPAAPELPLQGQGWAVHSGQTVGKGRTALVGEVGWPGLYGGLLFGAASRVDVGGRFGFNYGVEGDVTRIAPGISMQGVLRARLLETSRLNLAVAFSPGPFFYFPYGYSTVGLRLPFEFVLGIPVGSAVVLHLGMEVPLYVVFGPGGGAWLPLLVGGGAEYFIDQSLAVTFSMRMGPTIPPFRAPATFTLEALMGVAYRL